FKPVLFRKCRVFQLASRFPGQFVSVDAVVLFEVVFPRPPPRNNAPVNRALIFRQVAEGHRSYWLPFARDHWFPRHLVNHDAKVFVVYVDCHAAIRIRNAASSSSICSTDLCRAAAWTWPRCSTTKAMSRAKASASIAATSSSRMALATR